MSNKADQFWDLCNYTILSRSAAPSVDVDKTRRRSVLALLLHGGQSEDASLTSLPGSALSECPYPCEDYPCKSKRVGASTHSFTRIRKVTASLPSTTRWS